MYQVIQPILFSWITSDGIASSYKEFLPTNGKYVRTPDGDILFRMRRTNNNDMGLIYYADQEGVEFKGVVTDAELVARIATYWNEYFGREVTNCSTFASFLATGTFVPYERGQIVVPGTMQVLTPKIKPSVGDVICLMYINDRMAFSRHNPRRIVFREVEKERHDGHGFKRRLDMYQRINSPQEMHEMTRWGLFDDYHFMVCVDYQNGEPIWLSQCGWDDPATDDVSFVVTRGWFDPYPHRTHGPVFIRRRR